MFLPLFVFSSLFHFSISPLNFASYLSFRHFKFSCMFFPLFVFSLIFSLHLTCFSTLTSNFFHLAVLSTLLFSSFFSSSFFSLTFPPLVPEVRIYYAELKSIDPHPPLFKRGEKRSSTFSSSICEKGVKTSPSPSPLYDQGVQSVTSRLISPRHRLDKERKLTLYSTHARETENDTFFFLHLLFCSGDLKRITNIYPSV